MDRTRRVILLAVGLVLGPALLVGLLAPADHTTVQLTGHGGAVDAAGQVLQLPSNVRSPSAGALTALAVLFLGWLLVRDLRLLAMPDPAEDAPEPAGGDPRVVAARAPDASRRGLQHLAVAAVVSVAAAALLLSEGLGAGRNQVVGLAAGVMLLALAETVVAYAARFRPRFRVAEPRGDEP